MTYRVARKNKGMHTIATGLTKGQATELARFKSERLNSKFYAIEESGNGAELVHAWFAERSNDEFWAAQDDVNRPSRRPLSMKRFNK